MPMNPQILAKRARAINQKEIRDIHQMEIAEMRQPMPRKRTKLNKLLETIFNEYANIISKPNPDDPVAALPAHNFSHLYDPYEPGHYSRVLVDRAKKLLGIRSIKLGNHWCWTFPQRAPNDIQQKLYAKQLETWRSEIFDPLAHTVLTRRPIATRLLEVMRDFNYDAPSKTVVQQMGYNYKNIIRTKAALGIVSVKKPDGWYWVYPATEIQDWLLNLLADGPMQLETIYKAGAERKWSPELIRTSRSAVGGISTAYVDGHVGWRTT